MKNKKAFLETTPPATTKPTTTIDDLLQPSKMLAEPVTQKTIIEDVEGDRTLEEEYEHFKKMHTRIYLQLLAQYMSSKS